MSKVLGVVMILAGVGMASSLLPIASDADPGAPTTDIARSWSADMPRIATMVPTEQPAASANAPVAPKSQPTTPHVAASAPIVVTVPYRAEQAPVVHRHATQAPSDRASLARDLQRELRRVGCYSGELNGVWTPASRKAMKAFTDRINAVLPVEDPDSILLTLVQGHHGDGCGKPCPAKQGLSEDGRCLPVAILAHVTKKGAPSAEPAPSWDRPATAKPVPAITGWSTMTVAALPTPPSRPPVGDRMALAGPKVDARPGPDAADVPPQPTQATPGRNKTANGQRDAPRARSHERRDYVQRTPQRSRFVESVLGSNSVLWRY